MSRQEIQSKFWIWKTCVTIIIFLSHEISSPKLTINQIMDVLTGSYTSVPVVVFLRVDVFGFVVPGLGKSLCDIFLAPAAEFLK